MRDLEQARALLEAAKKDLIEYNTYAVQLRYGASESGDEPLDRKRAVAQIEMLLVRVQGQLAVAGGSAPEAPHLE